MVKWALKWVSYSKIYYGWQIMSQTQQAKTASQPVWPLQTQVSSLAVQAKLDFVLICSQTNCLRASIVFLIILSTMLTWCHPNGPLPQWLFPLCSVTHHHERRHSSTQPCFTHCSRLCGKDSVRRPTHSGVPPNWDKSKWSVIGHPLFICSVILPSLHPPLVIFISQWVTAHFFSPPHREVDT